MRFIIIVAFTILCPVALAATINVPGDYKTIQAAIDASASGDTVLVGPGAYLEFINFKGKAITVKSSDGPSMTIIDANAFEDVVTFENGEGLDSELTGFTITNGFGIRCFGASPTIADNLITNCLTYGISCLQSASPAIRGNKIYRNWQGINCDLNSSPMIVSNIIEMNDAVPGTDQGGTRGGGIYVAEGCSPIIVNNIIRKNKVYGGYNILGHWLIGSGGGIHSGGSATVANNTLYGNQALLLGGEGGGLFAGQLTTIKNSIIWGNYSEYGLQIFGNPDATYCDVQGGWPGTGNIASDPMFVDPATGDYHLSYPSPCRNAGDNTAVTETCDFEGDPRIAWGGTVDIGADEFHTHLYVTGDQTSGGNIQGKLVGLPGTSPVGLFIGSGVRQTPVPTPFGDYWLISPRILIPLVPIPSDGILVISTTIPISPPAPYDVPMQGLVGLNSDSLSNLYVLEVR